METAEQKKEKSALRKECVASVLGSPVETIKLLSSYVARLKVINEEINTFTQEAKEISELIDILSAKVNDENSVAFEGGEFVWKNLKTTTKPSCESQNTKKTSK
jgi:hypothetical protein